MTATATAAGGLVELADVEAAAHRLQGVALRTPLVPAFELGARAGGEVRLKCESLQRAGSFKIRGAYNFVAHLPAEDVARGIITYSSGNHAQAVALAARLRGVPAVVVMPTTAPPVKRQGAERLGARVVLEGTTSLQRKVRAEAIAAREGLAMIPPFDHPWIIAGHNRAPAAHLKVLARISRLFRDAEFRARLMAARTAHELYDVIAAEDRE